jgi:polyisoprenoid-binding protein YceI
MRILFAILAFGMVSVSGMAQKYFTRTGHISFFSETSMENIEAHNKTVTAIFDVATKKIQFAVTMKSFVFEKALMQEHFNENYVESDEFPKATFSGSIPDLENANFEKDGVYNVTVKGQLTIHGVTKEIEVPAKFVVLNGKVNGEAQFQLNPEDYDITIPAVVREKIAKQLLVDIQMDFTKK